MKRVRSSVFDSASLEHGPRDGPPAILLHGFPRDVRCHDEDRDRPGARHSLPRGSRHFLGRFERRLVARVGHNVPQEAPDIFADAVLALV